MVYEKGNTHPIQGFPFLHTVDIQNDFGLNKT